MATNSLCKATTKQGTSCKNLALPGLEYCAAHRHLATSHDQVIPTNPWEKLLAWWQAVKHRYWVLAAFVTLVAAAFTFVQLYNAFTGRPFREVVQSPMQTISTPWISASLYILGMVGTAASAFLAFRPETVNTPGTITEQRLDFRGFFSNFWRVRGDRRWRYPRLRPYALFALVLIPLLTIGSAVYEYKVQQDQASKFIVLVADFDGPEPQTYRVTETVLVTLRTALRSYERVEVLGLGELITEAEGSARARSIGEARNASIVIWGWYGAGKEVVPLSVHFERLCPLRCAPQLSEEMEGSVQTVGATELENFTLQTNVSQELSLVSLLIIGMSRFSEGDWNGAITSFSDALAQSDQDAPKKEVYYYRALSYLNQHRCDLAVNDLDRVLTFDPNFANAYNVLSACFGTIGNLEMAIALISRAIDIDDSASIYYMNRGTFHVMQAAMAEASDDKAMAASSYAQAFQDIDKAIAMSPDEIMYYQQRAGFHYQFGDYDRALADLNHCLELNKQIKSEDKRVMAEVHYLFGNLARVQGNDRQSLIEYTEAINKDPTYSRAFWGRGLAFENLGEWPHSIADLNHALELAEDPETKAKISKALQNITGK